MSTKTKFAAAAIATVVLTGGFAATTQSAQAGYKGAGLGVGIAAGALFGAALASNAYGGPVYYNDYGYRRCGLVRQYDVYGNYIGTNAAGDTAAPNGTGVYVDGLNNTVGGTSADKRNVISGNRNSGIYLDTGVTGTTIQGNYIGTDAAGTTGLAGGDNGISIHGASNNTIGGTTAAARNVISGNGFHGGLQFTPQTWRGFGGGEFAPVAYQASREQQIAVAERVLAKQGWGAWPTCSRKAGATGEAAAQRSAPGAQSVRLSAPAAGNYVVKRGDTLGSIAKANNVAGGWQSIVAKNPALAGNPNHIMPGQQLAI